MPRRPMPGRPSGKYTQAVRLFQLYHRLEGAPEGVRIDDVAHELSVTGRSIRRDLEALEAAGIEIESTESPEGRRVRLARTGRSTEPVRMTRFQRYSLAAARRVFDVLAGTPLHDDVTQVFAKLAPPSGSGNGGAGDPGDGGGLADRFVYIPEAPKNYRKSRDSIYDIYDGVLRTLTLSFTYETGSTPGTRRLEPYALVLYRNGLYVVGRDVAKKAWRTFAIERMKRVKALTNVPFVRDANFDVTSLFDGAFGIIAASERDHVVVDFTQKVATFVEEREWHPSQKITKFADGSVRCELDVAASAEVVAWVLRWGGDARVVAPPSLVARVRDEYERALRHYQLPSDEFRPAGEGQRGGVVEAVEPADGDAVGATGAV